jgi:4-amino-4-deoxy-L-arabinose transferase-like glycosyltransferase
MSLNKHIFLLIPLILSSFTHLWNVTGFPSFHPDEGVYIKRSLHILAGLGPQDPSSKYDHSQSSTSSYDHPYFGPIFLASVFKIIGYPQILKTTPDLKSIETLYTIPRVIMGVLAVIDTLLVYRICERKFNPIVALFAALLFAVMPLSWFMRRIVLDSIMLPFILTSILLALEIRSNPKYTQVLSILSGVSLGLAIFTKIPSFTLIPLVGFLIYQSMNGIVIPHSRLKMLALYLLPVVLIPMIWPAYAFLSGDLNEWIEGVLWQSAGRGSEGKTLLDIDDSLLETDPLLLILGAVGVIYLAIRREYIAIIWIIPYITLLYLVGWVTHFHLILIIPILCISIAKMIYDLPSIMHIKKKKIVISSIIILGIVIFGLISTTLLISVNLSKIQLRTVSYVANELVSTDRNPNIDNNNTNTNLNKIDNSHSGQVTVISSPIYSWVYKYIFNHNYTFSHVRDTQPIKTEKVILQVDSTYKHVISKSEAENETQVQRLMSIYNNTDIVALFRDDPSKDIKKGYPFTSIDSASIGSRNQEIRANY